MVEPYGGRFVGGPEIAPFVDVGANEDVLAYLAAHSLSAHSDLSDAVMRAADEGCDDWLAYSPSFVSCRYVALIINDRVFSLMHGQQRVCVRLSGTDRAEALRCGADAASEIGRDWVRFELFGTERPMPDLTSWLRCAYLAMLEAS